MDKNTLIFIKSHNFNKIMLELLTPYPKGGVSPDEIVRRTILIICLSTGLPLREVMHLKWNNLLGYNSKGETVCLDEFVFNRNYYFPINLKIRKQLISFFYLLNQPDYTSQITKSCTYQLGMDGFIRAINLTIRSREGLSLEVVQESEYRNENLTQILFGRRVFETVGYSNITSRFLKGLFKLKNNDELFAFLGYKSKSDINYNLNEISIIEEINEKHIFGKPRSFLDDNKHFFNQIGNSKNYFPFQHFQVFYEFLQTSKLYNYDVKSQGVMVLLMLSLTNGIRPSALLKLKWSDILCLQKNDNKDTYVIKKVPPLIGTYKPKEGDYTYDFVIKKEFKYGKNLVKIDEKTEAEILSYCRFLLEDEQLNVRGELERLFFSVETASLKGDCFVTNRLNPLTQPSLYREIKNTLRNCGFQHVEKFTTKSTIIMYGRRIIEIKGNHPPTIKALKKHFNFRRTQDLFKFLYISNKKKTNIPDIGEFSTVFEHILYDI